VIYFDLQVIIKNIQLNSSSPFGISIASTGTVTTVCGVVTNQQSLLIANCCCSS